MKKLMFASLVLVSCNYKAPNTPVKVKDTSEAAMAIQYMKDAKQTQEYKDAWIQVQRILIDVNLVKSKPILDQDRVVDEYNDAFGSTIGRVDNIKEVTDKLKNNGSDYLKIIQLNISASMALNEASEVHARIDTAN